MQTWGEALSNFIEFHLIYKTNKDYKVIHNKTDYCFYIYLDGEVVGKFSEHFILTYYCRFYKAINIICSENKL